MSSFSKFLCRYFSTNSTMFLPPCPVVDTKIRLARMARKSVYKDMGILAFRQRLWSSAADTCFTLVRLIPYPPSVLEEGCRCGKGCVALAILGLGDGGRRRDLKCCATIITKGVSREGRGLRKWRTGTCSIEKSSARGAAFQPNIVALHACSHAEQHTTTNNNTTN